MIRRLGVAVGTAFVVFLGCGGEDPQESPVVAAVGSDSLTVQRLADLLVLGQPLATDRGTAEALAQHWLEVAAFANHVRSEAAFPSQTQLDSMTLFEQRALHRDDYLRSLSPPVSITEQDLEAAFRSDQFRILAHVLRTVAPEASAPERDRQRIEAERVFDDLVAGGGWGSVSQRNEDPLTRDRDGLLGFLVRGDLPPSVEATAWDLPPGAFSRVVPSDAGFHVFYRPALSDVRGMFESGFIERRRVSRDSAVADSIAMAQGLTLSVDAVSGVRAVLADPFRHHGDRVVAEAGTGPVSLSAVARIVRRLPTDAQRGLAGQSDADLLAFVREVAAGEVVGRAAGEGPAADPSYQETVEEAAEVLRQAVEDLGSAVGAGGPSSPDQYLESVVGRLTPQLDVPAALAEWLLSESEWTFDRGRAGEAARLAGTMLASGS